MVISATDTVFIDVRQLRLNPGGVIALLVENGAQSVPEAVPGCPAAITYATDKQVKRHFADGVCMPNPTREKILISPADRLNFSQ